MSEEKKNEIAVPTNNSGLPAAPSYLHVENDTSIDDLKQYVRPNRIKVIQGTSSDELKDSYGVGSVVLVPDNTLILECTRNEKGNPDPAATPPFTFTPLYFFTEFCAWNPIQLKGQVPAIRERSFDQNSAIARKARDFKKREEPHPDNPEHKITYCEHMNFVIMLPEQTEPCVLTFSRGEFKAGVNFAGLCKTRSQGGVPLYGNIFQARLAYRTNNKGNWWGLDITNPDDGSPFVGEELFHVYKALHEEYRGYHTESKIDINYEDEVIDIEPATPSEAAGTM